MAQAGLDDEVPHRVFAMSMTKDTPEFGVVTKFEGDAATIALRGVSAFVRTFYGV